MTNFKKGELVRVVQNECESSQQSDLTDKLEFVRTVDDMSQLRRVKNKSIVLVPSQSVIRSDYSMMSDEELINSANGVHSSIDVDEVSVIKYRTSDNHLYSTLENAQMHEKILYRDELLKRNLSKVNLTLNQLKRLLKEAASLSHPDDTVVKASYMDWNNATIEDIMSIPPLVAKAKTSYKESDYRIDMIDDETVIISQIE